jgi:endonuclease/exonuclease/phosphatase family metal-dependent hydrolase
VLVASRTPPSALRITLVTALSLLLVVALGLGAVDRALAAPAPQQGGAPTDLRSTSRARVAIASWDPVPGSVGYQVDLARDALPATTTRSTVTDPLIVLTGLSPATDYLVSVWALDPGGGGSGTPSQLRFRTAPQPLPFLPPRVKLTSPTSSSIEASWNSPAPSVRYEAQRSTTHAFTEPTSQVSPRRTFSAKGLKPDTSYFVRVRVVGTAGRPLSPWSTPAEVETASSKPLRVASYNVLCANCKAWGPRAAAVAGTIRDQQPDVVGLQEASHGNIRGRGIPQYQDLANRVGGGYRLVNANRNASGAVRILYNTRTLALSARGTRQLADLPGTGKDRYVTWAVFTQKSTGKRFFFSNTHLEPRNDGGGSRKFYNIRRAQAAKVVQTIRANRRGLPVVAVGDFNSTKWDQPSNAPYDIMREAGYLDPLGNAYRSRSATGDFVEERIRTNYSSYNAGSRSGRRFPVNGSNPDYIFVTRMRVSEYETVVQVDGSGRLTGPLPSDHNMLRATVWLP